MDFAKLKRNTGKSTETLQKYTQEISSSQKFEKDPRYYRVTTDRAGEGSALLRFMAFDPSAEEKPPFVKEISYGFQGPSGKWYIETARTTINQPDPAEEYQNALWAKGKASGESKDSPGLFINAAKKLKRKILYITNVTVLVDDAEPANVDKTFLYKFGQKIYEKMEARMAPKNAREKKLNPFCPFEGANFWLKVKKQGDFPNYDDSYFETPSAMYDNDSDIEKAWKGIYDVEAEIAEDKIKSYDDLYKHLTEVLGHEPTIDGFLGKNDAPRQRQAPQERATRDTVDQSPEKDETPPWDETPADESGEADEEDAFFKKLQTRRGN